LKNQQFKDSAIWEAILELSESCQIHFVTEDKGFFESRDTGRGLASSLRAESEANNRNVSVYPDLTSLLYILTTAVPPFDTEQLGHVVSDQLVSDLAEFGTTKGFLIGDVEAYNVSAFLTEKSELLAISFEFTFDAFDISDENNDRMDYVVVIGNSDNETVFDLRLGTIEYHKADGAIVGAKSSKTIFGAGGITLGRKRKTYRFQKPLP
jgi:hypothetical protein